MDRLDPLQEGFVNPLPGLPTQHNATRQCFPGVHVGVKCSLAALNTKQQKDVVMFDGKITMGFVSCIMQVL